MNIKSFRNVFFILTISIFTVSCCLTKSHNNEKKLIFLSNSKIELGILPEVGGRVVILRIPGQKNILKQAPEFWNEADTQKPKIGQKSEWKAYYGITVWLSPQSNWKCGEKDDSEKNDDGIPWPPDPYLIYGKYKIVEKRADFIKLKGPKSLISGIQLIKEYWIEKSGKVKFKVTAKNISKEKQSWSLWVLARINGYSNAYVPVENDKSFNIEYINKKHIERGKMKKINNFFTFIPDDYPQDPAVKKVIRTKAFISPNKGFMAGFIEKYLFLIKFKLLPDSEIHPDHKQVEIYNEIRRNRKDTLLEIEHHSAFKTLLPGQSMSSEESWQLFEYKGRKTTEDQLNFINSIVREN